MAEQKKFLDFEGLSHYHNNLKTLLDEKQENLTEEQLDVVNANPFSNAEQTKLSSVAENAEVNTIISISVNGEGIAPDLDRNVDIVVPVPDDFISTEELLEIGTIGELLEDLDLTMLSPVIIGKIPSVGDVAIFSNGTKATITEIDDENELFSAVITQIGTIRILESDIDAMMGITQDPIDP